MLQFPLLGARAVQASSSRAFATLPTSASTARSNLVRHLQQPRFRPASASSPLSSALAGRRFASSGWSQAPRASDFEAAGGWKKVGTVAAVFGGAVVASNLFLNRETREALAPWERSHLNSTFAYTGLGLAMTGGMAYALHQSPLMSKIMFANPWVILALGVGGGFASIYGVRSSNPGSATQLAFFTLFQASQSIALAPLFFLSPALLARAGLYTMGTVGSLAFVGATAKTDKYLYLGGPLLAGLAVVALSSLAPMVLPRTALRSLAVTEAIALYGGLAVFSGMILYDTQKVLAHARMAAEGRMKADPVSESLSLELDTINIFVRMVQILALQQGGRRR